MAELLYCVMSPAWDHCKMGMWQGHYCDLWSRYSSTLGLDVTQVIVFRCHGRRALEQILFAYVRKFHVCGEVYEKAAFPSFLEFCGAMCDDAVPWDIANSAKDARDEAKQEKRRLRDEAEAKSRRDKMQSARQAEIALIAFVRTRCVCAAGVSVNAAKFRVAFCKAAGQKASQKTMQEMMAVRGFTYRVMKIKGRTERVYSGLRSKT